MMRVSRDQAGGIPGEGKTSSWFSLPGPFPFLLKKSLLALSAVALAPSIPERCYPVVALRKETNVIWQQKGFR